MRVNGELFWAQLENLTATPGTLSEGRVWYRTDTDQAFVTDGTLAKNILLNDQKLIVGTNGTAATNARLYRSGTGWLSLVTADDTTSEGSVSNAMARLSAFTSNRVSKAFADTPYTLLRTDTHVDVDTSGGAVTVTVPAAAAGNNGQAVWVRKTTSDFNAVTLATGVSTTLNTINEAVQIQSNGSAWVIIQRYAPSIPTSYTPTVGACGTVTVNECKYTRLGATILVEANITCGIVTGSAFTFSVPSGLTMDYAQDTIVGQFGSSYNGGGNGGISILVSPSNSTASVYYVINNLSSIFTRLNGNTFNIDNGTFTIRFMVRITGWNG